MCEFFGQPHQGFNGSIDTVAKIGHAVLPPLRVGEGAGGVGLLGAWIVQGGQTVPADVRSIPALREWLAALQVYRTEAQESLFGTSQELRRAQDWVEEQLQLWKRAGRDCEEAIVQAKAELVARRFPGHDGRMPDTTLQERNLRRAQAKLEHAEERTRKCQAWASKLPKLIEETYSGKAHRLGLFLTDDLEKAGSELARQIESLERYSEETGGGE